MDKNRSSQKINFKGIVDTTLRDGQQSPLLFDTYKYRFNLEDKKNLINGLIQLGVNHLEFFSPVVSKAEAEDFIILKDYIKDLTFKKIYLIAHCRCKEEDIDRAVRTGFNGLNLYLGISSHAQKYSYGKNFDEIFKVIKNTIYSTRTKYPDMYIRFSIEDVFRTPLLDIYKVYDEINQYVNTLGIPDTVGIATPDDVIKMVKSFKKRYPKVDLECHFHNDRGHSLINSILAVQAGAEYIDTSIWGLAERSGITSLTGFLLNLYHTNKSLCKNYNLNLCYPLNILMGTILKLQVPYTEPVSLTNRTHTAGVHQKAVLNNHQVYEAHDLNNFGVTKNQILLGPLSGWNLIHYYLKEILGYNISETQAKEITQEYKAQINKLSRKNKPEKLLQIIIQKYNLTRALKQENFVFNRIENLN